jgi:tetraacyldisaccharide 4'-kinase
LIRQRLEALLLGLWFAPAPSLAQRLIGLVLRPLSWLTRRIAIRRRAQILAQPAPPVPVIVVGNLIAGGVGKTPLVIAMAQALAARGWRPGLLARGHGARRNEARMVAPDDDAAESGDEAVLLARFGGFPVAAGLRRAEALALLRQRHPEVDLILSDDGLQHLGLPRTLELAVFDARGAGNGRLLPAGPLREPLGHAGGMDAILMNGAAPSPTDARRRFRFDIRPGRFEKLDSRAESLNPEAFRALVQTACGRSDAPGGLAAVAGIGAPGRFFDSLTDLGLPPAQTLCPGDHQALTGQALAGLRARFVVMTAKDAVKCQAWADDRCWVLHASARLDPAFVDWLDDSLREANLGSAPARHPGLPDLQGPPETGTRRQER